MTPDSSAQEHHCPRSGFLSGALLLAITLVVFQAVCRQPFVDWDDPLHTYQNPLLNPITPAHLWEFWLRPHAGHYVPVSYMLYAWLSTLAPYPGLVATPSGDFSAFNPRVFHTANLLLHLGNVWLVFTLLRRIVRRDWAAFGGALLFAVHPVQVESVAWVSELRGLLSNGFGLLALWQYLCYAQTSGGPGEAARSRRHYGVALAAFGLALLSKPSAVTLPLMAFVLDWGVLRRPWRRVAVALLGWALLALPIAWLTRGAQPVPPNLMIPLWQRPLIAGDALAFYLSKLLAPVRLAIDYGRTPAFVLNHPALWLTGAAPLLAVLLAWRRRGRSPYLLPALGLFIAALLPVLGFVPFIFQKFSTVADRYAYLALFGPALIAAWTLAQAKGKAVPVIYGVFLAACVCLSLSQIRVWNDSQALFSRSLVINPDSPWMQYNLANALRYQGRTEEAIPHYEEALRLDPDYASAHCNLGQALADRGDKLGAVAHLREALRLKPDFPIAHLCLGLQLADAGQTRAAIREWQETVRLWPENLDARYNLGCALAQRKRPTEAEAQFREILRRDPAFAPAQNALRQMGASAKRGHNPPAAPPGNRSIAGALPASLPRPRD